MDYAPMGAFTCQDHRPLSSQNFLIIKSSSRAYSQFPLHARKIEHYEMTIFFKLFEKILQCNSYKMTFMHIFYDSLMYMFLITELYILFICSIGLCMYLLQIFLT